MLRVETLVETDVYIVVFCTTLISGIYIGFTTKKKAASSKKEVKGVEESAAEEVTVATCELIFKCISLFLKYI